MVLCKNTEARNMKVDPNDHTRWKHKIGWQNRGCVWDRIASEWSGKEHWSIKTKRCQTAEDKRDFMTCSMSSVKHSVTHRLKIGESVRQTQSEERPEDSGTTRQVNFTARWDKSFRNKLAVFRKQCIQKKNCIFSGTDRRSRET